MISVGGQGQLYNAYTMTKFIALRIMAYLLNLINKSDGKTKMNNCTYQQMLSKLLVCILLDMSNFNLFLPLLVVGNFGNSFI